MPIGVAHRDRRSPWPAISMESAMEMIREKISILDSRSMSLSSIRVGDVLAEDVIAQQPYPSFPASIKDGYAVIASDGMGKRSVLGVQTAGDHDGQVQVIPGTCARISTGAPLPEGADAVVQVENTSLSIEQDGEELEINIDVAPSIGQDIRPIGSDIAIGEHLLSDRCVLGAAELGLLAMIGRRNVRVYRRASVSVLSTGNELTDDDHLRHGQIRDANRPSLLALFTSQGFEVKDAGIARDRYVAQGFEVKDAGIARDSELELVSALREVFVSSDVVVTSGGVSMGEKDLLKSVLVSSFGFTIHFGRVFMKPGLPSTFASGDFDGKRRFIFALPGNPVSAFVCAHLFVIPALRRMSGHWNHLPTILRVKLQETLRLDHRPEYRRAWLDTSKQQQRGDDHIPGAVCTSKNQMSSRLSSACGANLLLRLPAAAPPALTSINEGTVVDALVIAPL